MKPKVLLIAFAISPKRGGEAALGWNMAREIARHVDLTVVSAARDHKIDYRAELGQYLSEGASLNYKIEFIDPPKINKILEYFHDRGLVAVYHFWYINYQKYMYKAFKAQAENFDIIHQFNMIGFRYPGTFWKLSKPFIWGPVGGLAQFPADYFTHLDRKDAFRLRLRNWINKRAQKSKIVQRARAASSHIFAATLEAKNFFDNTAPCPVTLCPETGAQVESNIANRCGPTGQRLQVGWAGVGHPRKMPNLMRDIVRQAHECDFHIFGEGSNHFSSDYLPNARVFGILPRDKFVKQLRELDVLVHTSLLEGSPHVIAEALAAGVPCIAHNCCGMALMINKSCGVLVDVVNYEHSCFAFRQALLELSADALKLENLKRGAREAAAAMSWEKKASKIILTYSQALLSSRE